MGKKSGPAQPDYTGAAQATAQGQQQQTTQQTWANRPDQYSPFGSTTWSATAGTDPSTGQPITKWSQNTNLDPRVQGALDSQLASQQGRSDLANSMMGGVQQSMGQPMDWSQFTSLAQGPQGQNTGTTTNPYGYSSNAGPIQTGLDFGGAQNVQGADQSRQRAEDAVYSSQTRRLDDRFGQQQRALETDLANRGISRNSDAYTRAMKDFDQSKNDAYSQASLNAITAGGTEAQRNQGMDLGLRQQQVNELTGQGTFANQAQALGFGQGLQGQNMNLAQQQQGFNQNLQSNAQNFQQQQAMANYQNQLRQQQIAEAMQQRGQPLNEMNALLSGQTVSAPQFQNFGQAGVGQGTDYLSAVNAQYQGQLGQQSNRNAFGSDLLGGLTNIAGLFF